MLKLGDIIILESTSPVGTTEAIRDMIAELGWPLLIGGLVLSVPAALYLIGALVGGIAQAGKRK